MDTDVRELPSDEHATQASSRPSAYNEALSEKLADVHAAVRSRHLFIERIAIAPYHAGTDLLRTFASSNVDGDALMRYEARLSDVPSLKRLAETGESRCIPSMLSVLSSTPSRHSRWLLDHGYRSSFTVPIYHGKNFAGFVFFDAKREHVFTEDVTRYLELISHVIGHLYLDEVSAVRTLIGTVRLARDIAKVRDLETGNHLDRMALISRLIARELAPHWGLSDEFIEHLFLFAPLHDIGKIGIADHILHKPERLSDEEQQEMQRHVAIGLEIVNRVIDDMGLADDAATRMMRNVVACHHELVDGSGYPEGLAGSDLPPEARIIVTADIFDALLNERPYKKAWPMDRALAELDSLAGMGKLDRECVAALHARRAEVELICSRYRE